MRYALIREMDISNGKGIGVSLFVQGCHFHCKGCFNQETWDFDGGKLWNADVEEKFLNLVDRPFITRVSILGGEPLEERNLPELNRLISKIRETKDVDIWLYTGYTIETLSHYVLFADSGLLVRNIIRNVDYIVDGQFVLEKQDINHKTIPFAGSTNQRIIDVKESIFLNSNREGEKQDG